MKSLASESAKVCVDIMNAKAEGLASEIGTVPPKITIKKESLISKQRRKFLAFFTKCKNISNGNLHNFFFQIVNTFFITVIRKKSLIC